MGESHHLTYSSPESRVVKAQKIIAILRDHCGDHLQTARCLDLGCGVGVIAEHLHAVAGWVVGMEMERALIVQAPSTVARVQGDGLRLPYGDASFDVVVCAQVYEHVADAGRLVAEIGRVLKPGGACFFSGPNRLWPYEYHYRAWFVHWLPDAWRDRVLAWLGRSQLPRVQLYTWAQLRRLWRGYGVQDYTPLILRNPGRFPGTGAPGWLSHVPVAVVRLLALLVPNFNWVLAKPIETVQTSDVETL